MLRRAADRRERALLRRSDLRQRRAAVLQYPDGSAEHPLLSHAFARGADLSDRLPELLLSGAPEAVTSGRALGYTRRPNVSRVFPEGKRREIQLCARGIRVAVFQRRFG